MFPLQSSLVQDRQACISAGPSELRILGGAFPSQRTEDASPLQGRRACTSMFIPLLFTFHHPFPGLIPRLPSAAGTDVFFVVLFQRRHVHLFPALPAEPVDSAVHSTRRGIPARRRAKLTLPFLVLARTAFSRLLEALTSASQRALALASRVGCITRMIPSISAHFRASARALIFMTSFIV
nr:MAG TPA: hypothetical protein [Caudoviricetes sp.]